MSSFPRVPQPRVSRMGGPRIWAAFGLLAAAVVLLVGVPATAADLATGKIDLEAKLDGVDPAGGGSGTLTVTATLITKKPHYIYAEGEKALIWKPLEAEGVTYDVAKAKLSPTKKIEEEWDTYVGWMKTFTLKVPVTVAKGTKAGTVIGVAFEYSGCIKGEGCYGKIKDHRASVTLGGAAAAGGGTLLDDKPAKGAGGAMADATEPKVVAPFIDEDTFGGTAEVDLVVKKESKGLKGTLKVTFTPSFGFHMYGPNNPKGGPISVETIKAEGVKWGEVTLDDAPDEIPMSYSTTVAFTRTDRAKALALKVGFSACDDVGLCKQPFHDTFTVRWPGGKAADPEPVAPASAAKGSLLFPVVEGDVPSSDAPTAEDESSIIQDVMSDTPLLGFGLIFLIGLGLAFTPCVLPIIPITVSVITGGNADVPKNRLTKLLLLYVAGLALAFATMGTIAAGLGGSLSAAFAMPAVQWTIALVFFALAFSMAGVYELQPPAWLMNLQGGATKKSGSLVGAFLFGILGAIIASPCTAPAVAGMLIVTAKTGDLVLGFTMFLSLGLGMGAVFFAAGALNFLMRPGPWMVWVRYVFSVLLFGAALYYLASGGHISPPTLWMMGLVLAALVAWGVAWHLSTKEGEDPKIAWQRGAKVAVIWVLMIGVIAWLTDYTEGGWTKVRDRDHLAQLVAEAKAEGKPAVVDFWATWCHYCKEYDKLIQDDPELAKLFKRVKMIKVDLTDDAERWDMRSAVGLEVAAQPYMVLIDKDGRIRKGVNVTQWYGSAEKSAEQLKARLAVILGPEKRKDAGKADDAKKSKDVKPAEAGTVKTGDAGAPAGK